ncbi:MAG: hypothetical protein IPO91_24370 [Chloroflexi bacterium]|nr:hypothetical protein [Chloroflexota bacterium]
MAHNPSGKVRSEFIAELVQKMVDRANLTYVEVVELMGKRLNRVLGYDSSYSLDRFNRMFRAHDKVENRSYEVRELCAFVYVLTEQVSPHERCTAEEAFKLFNLSRVSLEDFKQLKEFFPEREYRAAWQPYLHLEHDESDLDKDQSFLKPTYPHKVIGRDQDIANLQSRLGANPNGVHYPFTVVRGWPGVGKTTVINRIVYDDEHVLRSLYPDGILWTTMGTDGDAIAAMRKWARQLGVGHLEMLQDEHEIIEQMRFALQDKRVLLVIDDIWVQKQSNLFKQIATDQTTFLFSTRFTDLAIEMCGLENVYFLNVLEREKSLELLQVFASNVFRKYEAELDALVETLEGLPLALRVAGRLMEEELFLGFDVTVLISELQTDFSKLGEKPAVERFDEATGQTPTIGLLFRRSIQTLATIDQEAFVCLGGFAPKPATFNLRAMERVCNLTNPQSTARALVGRGLLEPLGEGRFQMHYTLSMYAAHLLNTDSAELR